MNECVYKCIVGVGMNVYISLSAGERDYINVCRYMYEIERLNVCV